MPYALKHIDCVLFTSTGIRPNSDLTKIVGEEYTMELHGLAAVCVQHELDHLKGKLFVDALSRMKQDRIRKKLEKNRRLVIA